MELRAIELENLKPIPVGQGGGKPDPDMDLLSNIVKDFNDLFGNIEWKNPAEVQHQIEELPVRMEGSHLFVSILYRIDKVYAQITFNDDIINIIAGMLEEKTEFVQTYFANPEFQNYVNTKVFQAAVNRVKGK